jgi:hypothetical protein
MDQDKITVRKEKLFVVELEEGKRKYLYREARIKYVGKDYLIIVDDSGYNVLYTLKDIEKSSQWSAAYKEMRDFHDGLAAVCNTLYWGFINKDGNTVIKCQFDSVSDFKNGYAIAEKDGELFYINHSGEKVNEIPKEENDKPYIDMTAGIEKYLKEHPNYMVLDVYNDLGIAVVGIDGKDFYEWVGCIDKNGEVVIPRDYISGMTFHDGVASTDGFGPYGYAYVDQEKTEDGEIINHYHILPLKYKTARDYANGMGAVQDYNYNWTFVDRNRNFMSDFIYKNVEDFNENGIAHVQDQDDNWVYIDKTGRKVVRLENVYVIDVPRQFRLCGLTKREVLEKIKAYKMNLRYEKFDEDPKKLKLLLK